MGKRTEIVSFLILGVCFFIDKIEFPSVIKAILSASFLLATSIIWTRNYYTIALRSKKQEEKSNQTFWHILLIGILMLVITGITAGRELKPFLEGFLQRQPEDTNYYLFFFFSVFLPVFALTYAISSHAEKAKF